MQVAGEADSGFTNFANKHSTPLLVVGGDCVLCDPQHVLTLCLGLCSNMDYSSPLSPVVGELLEIIRTDVALSYVPGEHVFMPFFLSSNTSCPLHQCTIVNPPR